MADNMDYAPIGGLNSRGILEHLSSVISGDSLGADNVHYQNEVLSELGTPPVGGCTGDTTGHVENLWISAPWTCEDCPDGLTKPNPKHPAHQKMLINGKDWLEFTSYQGEFIRIGTVPERCTDCDTRYRKHKRTTKAIRAVFHHPNRMYKFEDTMCFVPRTKYRHIKLITLTIPNPIFSMGPVVSTATDTREVLSREPLALDEGRGAAELLDYALNSLSELKERFRRKRKLAFWNDHVLYGRYFAEVTWTVHHADGSKSQPTQWMPTNKELKDAVCVELHPHLHVIAAAKYMDKEELTDWWEFSTHIRATDRWMVCKDYLTKYVNKQTLPGRHQGTFGSVKKQ